MIIKGSVENIVYQNPQNNYSVIDIDNSGELITAVGIFPTVSEGEFLEIEGDMVNNPKFGMQLKAKKIKFIEPTTAESIVNYLASGLFKGIGLQRAKTIVDKFGLDTLSILEVSPMRLLEIRGIGKSTAKAFAESFSTIKRMQNVIMYLQQYNITTNLAIKIYKAYKDNTEMVLQKNPYKLIDDIPGVGFTTADKIAHEMGIEFDSKIRIRAGLIYVLQQSAQQAGNCYLPKEELISNSLKVLNIEDEKSLTVVMDTMLISGELVSYDLTDHTAIAFEKYYYVEKNIAEKLNRLLDESSVLNVDIDTDIAEYERLNKIELHENQKKAIKNAISNGIEIITGGPGTGKTTIIKAILYILKTKKYKVQLCAPTGRAAKRLSEATGEMAKTIHRLLDLDFKNGRGNFLYNESNKLPCDVVIIDEISMVDVMLFNSLLKALEHGTKLIIVGDKDQLPSVGAGNVLKDIIESEIFSVDMLTQIYRQQNDSLIITNAHKVNNGEMPEIKDVTKDFFFSNKESSQAVLDTVVDMCSRRLPKYLNISAREIQVLAPAKKGIDGIINLNKNLQEKINPYENGKKQLNFGETIFREGDKVMQTVNNYQMEWEMVDGKDLVDGVGVFNGDIGIIENINTSARQITVLFEDNRKAVYTEGEFDQLILSYAISIHKSQGSEFNIILIAISNSAYLLLNRNLLYTAITRAKKMVVIVGSNKKLYRMVKNDYMAVRYTLLKNFLKDSNR